MSSKWIMALAPLLSISTAWADRVESTTELMRLPAYCRGTHQVRDISGDPVTLDEYMKRYGTGYNHLHHYCWALNTENKVAITNPSDARSRLQYAINDIDYVLRNNKDPRFVFLPEIYASKARILFKLDRASDALPWLKKSIQANPGYIPAYARLSDYYAEQGDTAEAINILNQGIARSKHADMLKRRLKDLQVR